MIKTFYSDLDDFAFLTTPHYERARVKAINIMADEFGQKFPALEKVIEILDSTDLIEHEHGYHIIERFPQSLVKTYQEVARLIGIEPRKEIEEKIFEIGMGPFNIEVYYDQDLMPGYIKLMDYLKGNGVKLGVISKGQREYQFKKINYFNLWRWFAKKENIYILPQKTPYELANIIKNPESTIFGTDSLDDVAVALEAGIKVLHVPLPKIYTTSFNNQLIPLNENY
ncbi:MAG: HAD hydrolase-like protein [Nanoarchaeota archaeon]